MSCLKMKSYYENFFQFFLFLEIKIFCYKKVKFKWRKITVWWNLKDCTYMWAMIKWIKLNHFWWGYFKLFLNSLTIFSFGTKSKQIKCKQYNNFDLLFKSIVKCKSNKLHYYQGSPTFLLFVIINFLNECYEQYYYSFFY